MAKPSTPAHGHRAPFVVKDEDSDEDPVELMLKKTGCLEKHYKVQECIAESRDWRKCQADVEAFRVCMEEHKKSTL